jgi:hypothetical protein
MGRTLSNIGRSLGNRAASVFGVLLSKGGIAPPTRIRSRRSLSIIDREEISRGLVAGLSLRKIADQLGRSPPTISCEVSRNQGRWKYWAAYADGRAWRQASRPKACLLAANRFLQIVVAGRLEDNWSPQQISGWLKVEYLNDRAMRVSHETIYKSLFVQARGVLEKELISHLRSKRMMRRGKTSTTQGQPRGQIVDAVSIRERPAEGGPRHTGTLGRRPALRRENTHIATLYQFALLAPMCGVAAGLSRPSKHLIRLAFTMRSSPHNVGHHESRFPSLGISRAPIPIRVASPCRGQR